MGPQADKFHYKLQIPCKPNTERQLLLSLIASVYDPSVFLAPFIMSAYCYTLTLWATKLIWDEPICLHFNLLLKCASWNIPGRVVGYILRFLHNCRSATVLRGSLTPAECRNAICYIIRKATTTIHLKSRDSRTPEIDHSTKNASANLGRTLVPILDECGIMRVGGRLQQSDLSFYHKHSIILPKKHRVVNLLINQYRVIDLHAGPQHVQAISFISILLDSVRKPDNTFAHFEMHYLF